MSLDSFLRKVEDKINNVTDNCNKSVNTVKDDFVKKSDKYIEENFNDIKYSSDNINKVINDKIDEIFSFADSDNSAKMIKDDFSGKKLDANTLNLEKKGVDLTKK